MGDFIAGIIFIIFAFPILWNNEKTQVRIAAFYIKAEKAVKVINTDLPDDAFNYELVYATGLTKNETEIEDSEFGVKTLNSVRL